MNNPFTYHYGRPVWRAVQFLLVTVGAASAFILYGSYINWFPFNAYPAVGSAEFVVIWAAAIFVAWFVDFARFIGTHKKDSQVSQAKTR